MLRSDWTPLTIAGAAVIGIYFLVASFGVGGALTAFNSTLWTRLYKAMTGKSEAAAAASTPAA